MTETLGNDAEELKALRERYVPRGVTTAHPLVVDHAKGAELWDSSGRRYIDFVGGIGVMNVGHNHPRVMEAVRAQLERTTHTAFQVVMYESYLRLAERLCEVAPGHGPKKAIFFSTGAEAVENAVKIARAATGRSAVISFSGGFHGRTLLALSLTGTVNPYKQNFGPYAAEVYQTPFPYEYRGWSSEQALVALEDMFEATVSPQRVAAIIIEPVLGEGGFVPAPLNFLRALRELTERHGILLIVDEIQTGFGRTGRFFAIEHSGISPDLVTVAKSLAAGFPLSAVVGRADVMDAPSPGGLGGTYAGNPVACAAGLAVMDVMRDERLPERAARIGSVIEERMRTWAAEHELVGDVRVLGAMAGMELVRDRKTKVPADTETARILALARDRGLLLLRSGMHHNVIRTLMPLTIPDDQLMEGLDILGASLAEVAGVPARSEK
ncbi:MAG: 4-aminobutyrate transaminase [Actinobacteria bacterium 13_1_20CM_2_65_11]|nr:MAG: 4-aminobutyrate transaminase [Chloroflexi bacterium 13_1_40CM_65_17]OLD23205.1 MAG: 4-aminobutyrate transaminase [Chloroflexi bacterium 13_1_40CM_3_65_12]OLD50010.1 MAG: 4-aminobutyrate transaminase [Actinobacteria bacterium 13_1_40CM_2_65_8]OLE81678.1 MAG: 4-aminobutyrate transaminase [Actinobacteria bacterium 13_1_20CM_2_65_11]